MTIELTPQTLITAGSLLAAALAIGSHFAKGVRWFDKQEKQSRDIADLKKLHEDDVAKLKHDLTEEMRQNNAELQLLTYGVLACLKGLQEKGCNGPVTEAVNKIEKYLNQKAHEV